MRMSIEDFEEYDELQDNNEKDVTKSFKKEILRESWRFSYLESFDSVFGGTMPKLFLRVNTNIFTDLIKEQLDPQCVYKTCLGDVSQYANVNTALKNLPKKISVMVKGVHESSCWENEDNACKIANKFGIPTAYFKSINCTGNRLVMSVDFLEKDEKLHLFDATFSEVTIYDFLQAVSLIHRGIKDLQKQGDLLDIDEKKMIEDFVEGYLFRRYIIRDDDLVLNNLAIIQNNSTGKYSWAPCFDMEYVFGDACNSESMLKDLCNINKHYPKPLVKAMTKFSDVLSTRNFRLFNKYEMSVKNNAIKLISNFQKAKSMTIVEESGVYKDEMDKGIQ